MTGAPRLSPGRAGGQPRRRGPVLRWQVGYGTFGVPQAAAPIAFALVALAVTGSAAAGAALVFAMTTAQVLGAVPVSRLGARFDSVHYLRGLIALRTLALAVLTVLAAVGVPFPWLVVPVAAAGLVNGAAYGYLRLLLNHLVEPGRLPRALGVAATLNEVTFAAAPALAALLGAISPTWALATVTALGVAPLLLIPSIPGSAPARATDPTSGRRPREPMPRGVVLWLLCAGASGAVVAAVEVGAVSFALALGLEAGWAFLFALALCAGSVTGGIWVSVRNRVPGLATVAAFLAVTAAAAGLILAAGHLVTTLAAAAVVGFLLPVLGTFYSLVVDRLAPPHRRAELFALLRTANNLGVITVSGMLALLGLRAALVGAFALLVLATVLVTVHAVRVRGALPSAPGTAHA
ncbi:MFS transporter [Tersicoccus solisilvae]|uniref:MFS transporter n=1 Tax=Tersicoccus solisilvae TaxID=1882339 RepID=A0ABQ1NND2_9MICC|nr:MFS transporter [Tersicoccus solisilvae]GGC81412.1 MFS transporter [Tersicoccus solisilvae]